MKHHRYIWALAAAVLAAAAAVLGARQAIAPATEQSGLVGEAIRLLKEDPSAWDPETRTVIRAAAVEVEAGRARGAEAFYVLALQYMRERNFNGAEALFKRAIAAKPGWSWPYVGLGNLLGGFVFGRTDEAETVLRKAAELDPAWSRPYDSLAIILRIAGEYKAAEEAALKAIELAPDSVATNTNYANLLVSLDRLDEAETYYRRAIDLEPGHPKPYYNLACLFSLMQDPDRATGYLARAIELSGSMRVEARTDSDFDPIRDDPGFRKLVYIEEFRDHVPEMDAGLDPEPTPQG
jgi:tetratricopeptide (TPR) repeat protein